LFITAGVLFAISSFCCVFTVDVSKKDEIAKTVKSVREYIKDVGPVFKQPIVLLFAALMGLIYLNNTPYGFIISYMSYEKMQAVDPSTVTMIAYLSQAIILPIIGFCLDKYGRMRTISTYLILCIASLTVLLTPFKYGYILVYIMYGTYALFISMAKIRVANEVVAAQNRFDVIVFVNVFGVLIGSVCSAVYGIIVQVTNTRIPIFIISIISSIFIVIVCYKIHQYIAKKNQAKIDRIHSNLNDTERKVYENQ